MSEEKGQVLYVDDEEINLINFREAIEDEFEIFTAISGEQALEVLAKEGEMALVVSDQRMPGMTGIELLTLIKDKYPESVRMIISAYTEIGELIEAINKAEVYRYYVKPWEDDGLRLTVRNAVKSYNLAKEVRAYLELRGEPTRLE